MFVISIHYTKPLAEVDAARPAHAAWIKAHADAGRFLFCGRKADATGGVIIADFPSRAALDAALPEDGYVKAGVARHDVIEFTPGSGSLLHALAPR